MGKDFPGIETPGASFDEPFEMLHACHARTQRTLRLFVRLADYVKDGAVDDRARSAAEDVLRFFDRAAPLHHEDEDRHVFPVALRSGDESLGRLVARLAEEHVALHEQWLAIARILHKTMASSPLDARDCLSLKRMASSFRDSYEKHIECEETLLFPFVATKATSDTLSAMGAEMRSRRVHSPR
jgi:hemerythrin-like domain-containing protein